MGLNFPGAVFRFHAGTEHEKAFTAVCYLNMSLRTKFTLYISFLILFIILGISESVFLTQKTLLTKQFEENRNRIFKDFTYSCNAALVVNDQIQIFNTIKSVIKTHNPAIVYAGFISPTDTVLFSARDPDQEKNLKSRMVNATRAGRQEVVSVIGERIFEYSQPFYIQNQYTGTLRAGFSHSYLELQIKDGLWLVTKTIIFAAIISLFIGIILANVIALYLSKPIDSLVRAAEQLGSGNLDVKVNINRKDELGSLGNAFNRMVIKLKEFDELKDGFVSSVSHDLRSPLAAIDGYCDYMLEGLKINMAADKQEKSLKIMKDATIRLTNFINNILDLAKIKAGKFEVRKMTVSINDLGLEIVSLFESLAAQQGKKLKYESFGEIPLIEIDPEKIKQVITNLIGNAMKFTMAGAEITVSARPVKGTGTDVVKFVEVWIADTGVGIPQEDLSKVFERFFQVQESQNKKPKGTGLGLAIVTEIIKLHEGKIWVESTLGQGSVFKFVLPVTHAEGAATSSMH